MTIQRASPLSPSSAILGLDIGTNSIGWALLSIDEANQPSALIDAGVRIFPEAVDAKTKTPLNAERRAARQLRRQLARRVQRKNLVRGILLRNGLWSVELVNDPKPEGMFNRIGDPLRLRAEGLDRALTPHEFGRVLFQFASQRGFRSNRKERAATESAAKSGEDKETAGLVAGIAALDELLAYNGTRTVGEHLYRKQCSGHNHRNRRGERKTFLGRGMVEHEFDLLWAAQSAHDPQRLTPALRIALRRAIFFQRPLRPQKRQVRCVWEASRGRVRHPASWAWPLAQRFRLRQELNHLRILKVQTQEYVSLDLPAINALAAELETKEKLTWTAARKVLKKVWGRSVLEEERFSREDAIDHLTGNRTAVKLRGGPKSPMLEDDWDTLDEWLQTNGSDRLKAQLTKRQSEADQKTFPQTSLELTQDLLVADLLTIDDAVRLEDGADALIKRLQTDWGFDLKTAEKLAAVRLEEKPGRVSLSAMRRIMPHLMNGHDLMSAAVAAGYKRQDQIERTEVTHLPGHPTARNPVVDRSLAYVREIINAILRRYGRPVAIRIEMARDLKQSKDEKFQTQVQQKENQKRNERADAWWNSRGVSEPNHDHRLKYRLWEEQQRIGGICPYTGVVISEAMLASDAVQIDHIIPYARCLDDSFANKVLCLAEANTEKGNRTPWEWLSGDKRRYEAVLEHLGKFSPGKRSRFHPPTAWRFLDEEKRKRFQPGDSLIDDFTSRQLNDTRHIAASARTWLNVLYPSHSPTGRNLVPVQVCRGGSTALLRHVWQLNHLLSPDGSKNRSDHRHHSVDAAVIACTDPNLYQRISRVAEGRQTNERLIRTLSRVTPPFALREQLTQRLATMIISHAVKRRIAGGFHQETAYGLQGTDEKTGKLVFHYRKRLDAGFKNAAEIVDDTVRKQVLDHLAKHGNDAKAAFAGADLCLHVDGTTPITTVRIRTQFAAVSVMARERKGRVVAYYQLGNNHHMELWRITDANGKAKVEGVIVTALEAAKRVRKDGETLYPHRDGTDRALITSLTINDTVEVPNEQGVRYYRVQVLSTAITLRDTRSATLGNDEERLFKVPSTFVSSNIRKVFVDCLGVVGPDDQAPHRDRQSGDATHPPSPIGGGTPT
jgi:CRISPR-associated endonuclease Csn1